MPTPKVVPIGEEKLCNHDGTDPTLKFEISTCATPMTTNPIAIVTTIG